MDNGYDTQGYCSFPEILSSKELQTLRQACDTLLSEPAKDGGKGRHTIGLGESRRFLAHRHEEFEDVEHFLLGKTIKSVIENSLGQPAYLFNEQFVVKGPKTDQQAGAAFAWHQDGAYVGFSHKPYVTVWIALDDTTEENGCVYLIPRDIVKNDTLELHEWQDSSNELNGYTGEDTGIPMTCPAGSIVAFSSLTLHRSGENHTNKPRRAYVCQYTLEPLVDPDTGKPKRFAKPVI